ncbi:MAG: LysE family transporter [Verrucomicrobiota bacterium]
MAESHPILVALMAGFTCGLFFSALPGPINLTILNEGAKRGFKWGFFIGLGAVTMDIVYCTISFTGISQLIDHGLAQTIMRVAGFVFLLFLGSKFLSAKLEKEPTPISKVIGKIEERIEHKVHPHTAYATGVVRVAANMGVLAAWVVLAATLMSTKAFFSTEEWVDDSTPAKAACISGIALGALLWFFFWSSLVARGQGKFSARSLLRLQHFSGIGLIAIAVYEGVRIAMRLAS